MATDATRRIRQEGLDQVGSLTAKAPEREQRMRPTRPNQTLRSAKSELKLKAKAKAKLKAKAKAGWTAEKRR